jgi:hypothetical protein
VVGGAEQAGGDFDAASDLRRLGLLCAMWRYGEEELRLAAAFAL